MTVDGSRSSFPDERELSSKVIDMMSSKMLDRIARRRCP